MGEAEKKKIGIRTILAWGFSILFILSGAASLTESFFGGILILLGGLLIFPPFGDYLKNKFNVSLSGWLKVVSAIILLGIGGNMLPTETTTEPPSSATKAAQKVTAEHEVLDISFFEFNSLFGMRGTLTDLQKEEVFKSEYKGKYVEWTCELKDVDEAYGQLYMRLRCDPDTFTGDMTVYLRDDQKNKAISLTKDRMVTFRARLRDYGEFLGHGADDGIIVG